MERHGTFHEEGKESQRRRERQIGNQWSTIIREIAGEVVVAAARVRVTSDLEEDAAAAADTEGKAATREARTKAPPTRCIAGMKKERKGKKEKRQR